MAWPMNSAPSRCLSSRLPKLAAAEIIRHRNFHRAGAIRYRGVNGAGVEAIVDRDIAGQRIVDALLGLDRQHGAPGGHVFRPLDGVDPDIGAAIDRHHAVAVALAAQIQRAEQQIDFVGIVVGVLQELEADAVACIAVDDHLIEPVHDEGAVIGRGGDEGELAGRFGHGGRARRRTRKQGSRISVRVGGSGFAVNGGEANNQHPCDQGRFLRPLICV